MNRSYMGSYGRWGRMVAQAVIASSCTALWMQPAQADDYYKGKTITMYVGSSTGGGYDLYARLLARHLGNHVEGKPTVIVSNMIGAGGVVLANHLYARAPKDGTAIATFARGIPFQPLMGHSGAQFKDASSFEYVGSTNKESSVCVAWRNSGVETFDDLYTKPLIVGGFGSDTESEQHVKIVNSVLGTKMKLVKGYKGGNEVVLAMEAGEVQGRCGFSWTNLKSSYSDRLKRGDMKILMQNSLQANPEIHDVPVATSRAKSERELQMLRLVFAPQEMGHPYLAPPNTDPKRLNQLRRGFDASMKDSGLLEQADKLGLEISPMTGEAVQDLVTEIFKTPKDVVESTAKVLRDD